jgi:hypothetical protein
MPGYGPAEAEKDLHHWTDGDPEETGGAAAHLEQNDPRIRRWQQRHQGASMTRDAAALPQVVATANFGQLGAHMREHGWDGNSFRRAYHIDDGPLKDRYDWSDTGKLSPSELHAVHAWLHDQEGADWPDAWTEDGLHSHTAKKQRVQDMSDDDLAAYRESQVAGQEWVKRNPPKAEHVVAAYHRATDAEKAVGATWYADAHRTAQDLAHHTGVTHDQATDLIANYSPGAHWSSNLHAAVHVARTGKPVGGPGAASGGFNATTSQADHAQRILTEHAQTADVFGKTAHKVRAFAHLIRHGGNEDDGDPQVCVDRHAASVACGARVPDNAEGYVPLDSQRGYGSFKKAYVDAAQTISQTESRTGSSGDRAPAPGAGGHLAGPAAGERAVGQEVVGLVPDGWERGSLDPQADVLRRRALPGLGDDRARHRLLEAGARRDPQERHGGPRLRGDGGPA